MHTHAYGRMPSHPPLCLPLCVLMQLRNPASLDKEAPKTFTFDQVCVHGLQGSVLASRCP